MTKMDDRLTREQIAGLKDALLGHHIPPCSQEQWRYVCDLALSALRQDSSGGVVALPGERVSMTLAQYQAHAAPQESRSEVLELRQNLGEAVVLMLQSGDQDCIEFAQGIPVEFHSADGAPSARAEPKEKP